MEAINNITSNILKASIDIHSHLGPGLFESVYEEVLYYKLQKIGLEVKRQVPIPIVYEEVKMDVGFRADLIVEGKVIVELKSVDVVHPVHKKQVLTYLSLANKQIGLLINFNEEMLRKGITRLLNKHFK